jgi:uncharacterized protein (UPF0276 family)
MLGEKKTLVSRFQLPDLGIGVGYRVPHYRLVVEEQPAMDWFEVLSENFMVEGGSPRHFLEQLAARYPLVPHGVSLSLGAAGSKEHQKKLVQLVQQLKAPWFSDHLCWTGTRHFQIHDLLPVPYHPGLLDRMVDRIAAIQDQTGTVFAVENVSAYMRYKDDLSPLSEWEFLAELAERADCGILLDVNNVFVSSQNLGFDPKTYLNALPHDRIVQIHLAGHSVRSHYRLDTHDAPVCEPVWELYKYAIGRIGPVSTLIEWDGNIPPFARLQEEAEIARTLRQQALVSRSSKQIFKAEGRSISGQLPESWQEEVALCIRAREDRVSGWLEPTPALNPAEQLEIYQSQYRLRLYDALVEEVPGLVSLLKEQAEAVLWAYLDAYPSTDWTLNRLGYQLLDFLKTAPLVQQEMAALEIAVSKSFEAKNPEPIALNEGLPSLKLASTVHLFHLSYPVHRYRTALLSGQDLPELQEAAFFLVIFRRGLQVRHLEVEPELYSFLKGLKTGQSTEEALLSAVESDPERLLPKVNGWFQTLSEARIVETA